MKTITVVFLAVFAANSAVLFFPNRLTPKLSRRKLSRLINDIDPRSSELLFGDSVPRDSNAESSMSLRSSPYCS
eukprot:30947-Pelagococcus_subviridis.AAC.15